MNVSSFVESWFALQFRVTNVQVNANLEGDVRLKDRDIRSIAVNTGIPFSHLKTFHDENIIQIIGEIRYKLVQNTVTVEKFVDLWFDLDVRETRIHVDYDTRGLVGGSSFDARDILNMADAAGIHVSHLYTFISFDDNLSEVRAMIRTRLLRQFDQSFKIGSIMEPEPRADRANVELGSRIRCKLVAGLEMLVTEVQCTYVGDLSFIDHVVCEYVMCGPDGNTKTTNKIHIPYVELRDNWSVYESHIVDIT